MRGEDDNSAVTHQVLDGGNGGANPGVVGDVEAVVEGDVEIDPDEHPLPLQIGLLEGSDALLRRHCCGSSRNSPVKEGWMDGWMDGLRKAF